jgi:hypothetical protein
MTCKYKYNNQWYSREEVFSLLLQEKGINSKGELIKPIISKSKLSKKFEVVNDWDINNDGSSKFVKRFDTKEQANDYLKNIQEFNDYAGYKYGIIETPFVNNGLEPKITKDDLKETIENIKNSLNQAQDNFKADFLEENGSYYRLDEVFEDSEDEFSTSEPQTTIIKVPITKETYNFYKPKEKEYTTQALINTKIATLKEVAKKYPRSLIRSEVIRLGGDTFSDTMFQKVANKPTPVVYSASGEPSTLYPKIVEYIKENGFNANEPYYKDYLEEGYIKDYTPEELAIVHYNLAYPNENIEPAQLFETLTGPEKLVLENYEIDPNTISTAEAKLIVYNPNEAIRQTMTYYKTMRGNNTENFYVQVRDKQDKLYKDYGCM